MIILSQDRKRITEKLELYISENLLTNKYSIINEDNIELGRYETEERAKEVLEAITNKYAYSNMYRCIMSTENSLGIDYSTTQILNDTALFYYIMPEK